jgi:hypothetical protein
MKYFKDYNEFEKEINEGRIKDFLIGDFRLPKFNLKQILVGDMPLPDLSLGIGRGLKSMFKGKPKSFKKETTLKKSDDSDLESNLHILITGNKDNKIFKNIEFEEFPKWIMYDNIDKSRDKEFQLYKLFQLIKNPNLNKTKIYDENDIIIEKWKNEFKFNFKLKYIDYTIEMIIKNPPENIIDIIYKYIDNFLNLIKRQTKDTDQKMLTYDKYKLDLSLKTIIRTN